MADYYSERSDGDDTVLMSSIELTETPGIGGIMTSTPNGAAAAPVPFGAPLRRRQRTVAETAVSPLFPSTSRGDVSSVRPSSPVNEAIDSVDVEWIN